MPDMRDYERDELDYRRGLSTDAKVDLLLDRFLGNRLKGIIGQMDVLEAINGRMQSFTERQEETMQKIADIEGRLRLGDSVREQEGMQHRTLEERVQRLAWRINWIMAVLAVELLAIIIILSQVFV